MTALQYEQLLDNHVVDKELSSGFEIIGKQLLELNTKVVLNILIHNKSTHKMKEMRELSLSKFLYTKPIL